jgi:hypothetical protein
MTRGHEIAAAADPLEGRYSNYFKIGHNVFEFILDFGQMYGDPDSVRFHTRIITGPVYARALSELLQEALQRYTETFGAIREDDAGEMPDAE